MLKLWISDKAIAQRGRDYFKDWKADDINREDGEFYDSLLVQIDDMGNKYLSINAEEYVFTEVNW